MFVWPSVKSEALNLTLNPKTSNSVFSPVSTSLVSTVSMLFVSLISNYSNEPLPIPITASTPPYLLICASLTSSKSKLIAAIGNSFPTPPV